MKFTKKEFESFRQEFNQAMVPLAEKYALSITAGKISYGDDTFSMKVDCSKTDAGDLKQKNFEKYCSVYGLSAEDYKREFVFNGDQYALVGFSLGSPKYPCICVDLANKKQYKLTEDAIKKALGRCGE